MRSRWPGYVSCGAHGQNGFGYDSVDLDCAGCVRFPKAKTEGEHVALLRRFYGLVAEPQQVAVGEQLALAV